VFAKFAKSFDLAFRIDKIKTKCKNFGYGLGGKISAYHPPYLP